MINVLHSIGWALSAWTAVAALGSLAVLVSKPPYKNITSITKTFAILLAIITFLLTL